MPPLEEDNDLDYHLLSEDFFTTVVCWLLILFLFYILDYIFDLLHEEDYQSYVHTNSFMGSSPFLVFSEDWDIIYDDTADDDIVDTYEEDAYFNVHSQYSELDGFEEDVNMDVPLNIPFFESVYNSGDLVERIHWAGPLGALYAS